MSMLAPERLCSCGSGRAARGCCGRFRRVGERQAAVAFLARQERQARDLLGGFSPTALATLRAEAASLPSRCDRFTTSLLAASHAVTSGVAALGRSLARDAGGPGALDALRRADTPMARVVIAETMLALREAAVIDEHLAAAALIELAGGRSELSAAALLRAGARSTGAADGRRRASADTGVPGNSLVPGRQRPSGASVRA